MRRLKSRQPDPRAKLLRHPRDTRQRLLLAMKLKIVIIDLRRALVP